MFTSERSWVSRESKFYFVKLLESFTKDIYIYMSKNSQISVQVECMNELVCVLSFVYKYFHDAFTEERYKSLCDTS